MHGQRMTGAVYGYVFWLTIILALSVLRPCPMTLIQHGLGFGGKVTSEQAIHGAAHIRDLERSVRNE
jgi:hypothetical protein